MTHPPMEVEYALFILRELPMRALRITRRHLPPTLNRNLISQQFQTKVQTPLP